ncbi:hypothetical protein [Aeoliella mucimassa]|uniref:hypothetical protein n=1 Tax=Aeoliella mucimassa TaxID=2527972 RepID=UPI001E373EC0|nr:hypothetical protein [Aeoliella mucimassa]
MALLVYVDMPALRILCGISLFAVGMLSGTRITHEREREYQLHIQSLNQYLADQNIELAELNLQYLQEKLR